MREYASGKFLKVDLAEIILSKQMLMSDEKKVRAKLAKDIEELRKDEASWRKGYI